MIALDILSIIKLVSVQEGRVFLQFLFGHEIFDWGVPEGSLVCNS
jgi:hypothetical protein